MAIVRLRGLNKNEWVSNIHESCANSITLTGALDRFHYCIMRLVPLHLPFQFIALARIKIIFAHPKWMQRQLLCSNKSSIEFGTMVVDISVLIGSETECLQHCPPIWTLIIIAINNCLYVLHFNVFGNKWGEVTPIFSKWQFNYHNNFESKK